jgi:Flp pilus assembly protein TadG
MGLQPFHPFPRIVAMTVISLVRRLRDRMRAFVADRRGNVAITFGIAAVPLVLATGAAVDYSVANGAKAKLDALADAAALSAVNKPAMALTAEVAKKNAENMFKAQAGLIKGVTLGDVSVKITESTGRSSLVTYAATTDTTLAAILGVKTMQLGGNATAHSAIPTYIDFYLLLDNTPSMGVAATPADVDVMVKKTPDKCAFACHDLSDNNNYYQLAKKNNVTLRIDVMRQATQKLMDTATETRTNSDQFRMAIYTFGTSCTKLGVGEIFKLSTNLASAKTNADKIDLMTIPNQGYNNDQCTDFDEALTAINDEIKNPGDGTKSDKPQKILFFVSDGVADANNPGSCSKPLTGGTRCQEPIDISFCEAIKKRWIKIAGLYTTYLPLPTNDWYNKWIKPFSSEIGPNMEKCASPGLYFEVSPTQGISDAMTKLFQKVVQQARLTQ